MIVENILFVITDVISIMILKINLYMIMKVYNQFLYTNKKYFYNLIITI